MSDLKVNTVSGNAKTTFHQVEDDLSISIDNLEISHLMEYCLNDDDQNKEFSNKSYLVGYGHVVSDNGLGIVCRKETFAEKVSIYVSAQEEQELRKYYKDDQIWKSKKINAEDNEIYDHLEWRDGGNISSHVHLDFFPEDEEYGQKQQWKLFITVTSELLEQFSDKISKNLFHQASMKFRLRGLYTNDYKVESCQSIRFYLQPDEKNGAESAYGYIREISFSEYPKNEIIKIEDIISDNTAVIERNQYDEKNQIILEKQIIAVQNNTNILNSIRFILIIFVISVFIDKWI